MIIKNDAQLMYILEPVIQMCVLNCFVEYVLFCFVLELVCLVLF